MVGGCKMILKKDIRIGVEVEVENAQALPRLKYWDVVGEAMLKNGAEYVLRKPLSGESLTKAMDELYDKFTAERFTQRCGTHIHVDIQPMSRVELFNFITLYVVFEPLILKLLQEERVGNCFAVPVADSVGIQDYLIDAAKGYIDLRNLGLQDAKYGAINLASIGRLGSLEFRALHGTGDKYEVLDWIDVYRNMYSYATTEGLTPDKIISEGSIKGQMWLFEQVGLKDLNVLSVFQVEDLMYEGVRNAQFFAFSGDWVS